MAEKFVKAAVTINVSEANGANETGIWQSKIWQFFILSIHLSTWTLKQATFLFFAASSLEVRSARKLMTEHTTYQEQNKTSFQCEKILYVINYCLKTNHQDQTSSPILLALENELLLLGWGSWSTSWESFCDVDASSRLSFLKIKKKNTERKKC